LRKGCFCLAIVNTSQVENVVAATMKGQTRPTMIRKVGMAAFMLMKPFKGTIEIKANTTPIPRVSSSDIMNATIHSANVIAPFAVRANDRDKNLLFCRENNTPLSSCTSSYPDPKKAKFRPDSPQRVTGGHPKPPHVFQIHSHPESIVILSFRC
jgi:hypothetical protein